MSLVQEQVILAPYTSWLIGGVADYFTQPVTIEELQIALQWAEQKGVTVTILGGGSNVLISDKGIRGLAISLRKFSGLKVSDEKPNLKLEVLAGTSKSELLRTFLKYKLSPALFLAGIPGDVGGGVVMNAGVSEAMIPREFNEIVEWVEVLKPDSSLQKYQQPEIQWSYRHSSGWQPGVITRVGLSWPNRPDPSMLEKVKQANKLRLSKQPLDMPSCGSVFINPQGHKAAQLIDSCGLKGFAIGGAQVSEKHANFIVNTGRATASEVWQVIEHVQNTVQQERGVLLKTEVIRLGEWAGLA
jgi:UDP-N-acetylmuramate dehydrogenase